MDRIIYYCSNCGLEVAETQVVCPKCGMQLEGLNVPDDEAFTAKIRTFDSTVEANMAKAILEEEGIESFINYLDYGGGLSDSVVDNPIHLYVMEKDYARALKILDEYDNAGPV